MCVSYVQSNAGDRLLAVAGQEGFVSVYETSMPGRISPGAHVGAPGSRRAHFLCHDNSIFDLAWAKVRAAAPCVLSQPPKERGCRQTSCGQLATVRIQAAGWLLR